MEGNVDYYEVLGLQRDCSSADIQRSYRKLAIKFHPDKNSSNESVTRFQELCQAYFVLSDLERRYKYDHYGTQNLDKNCDDFGGV
jgi:DnaJ-class molecular chaperone